MQDNRFEQFIKQVLERTDLADALRNITERNLNNVDSSLESTVDNFLLESQLESFFNPMGYSSIEKKYSILNRLNQLKNLLDRNSVAASHSHYISVDLCISIVSGGGSLNKTILEYLNIIYRQYA